MADVDPDFSDTLDNDYQSIRKGVGATAVLAAIGGSTLSGRELLLIYNDGSKDIYFGPSSVSKAGTNKGIPIAPGETASIKASRDVYLISQSGTQQVIIQEFD